MKAISLTQPWATLVAIGAKQIETRGWRTSYRGALAIHAAKAYPADARCLAAQEPFADALLDWYRPNGFADPPRGAIVAVAQLVECFRFDERTEEQVRRRSSAGRLPVHEADFGDYAPGRYGFVLGSVVRLWLPVACKGALSLWDVPADVLADINRQIADGEAVPA